MNRKKFKEEKDRDDSSKLKWKTKMKPGIWTRTTFPFPIEWFIKK